jgi:hypothetical protein
VDYKTISKMTAAQLRDQLASQYPDVTGVSAMKKEKLVDILCNKLGIDRHTHAAAAIDKTAIKQSIRQLKKSATRRWDRRTARRCPRSTTRFTSNVTCCGGP